MPLSPSSLASDIKTQIKAIPGIVISSDTELQNFCTALATAIVNNLTANAVINPGTFAVTTAPGAVTGAGTLS